MTETLLLVAVGALGATASVAVSACGYDLAIGGVSVVHPSSIPVAVAIGLDPAITIAAGARYDGDELCIAGAIRGTGVKVCRGVTVDIDIPAEAEIESRTQRRIGNAFPHCFARIAAHGGVTAADDRQRRSRLIHLAQLTELIGSMQARLHMRMFCQSIPNLQRLGSPVFGIAGKCRNRLISGLNGDADIDPWH